MTNNESDTSCYRELTSVLLPYIQGVSYEDLNKILDDEAHNIADFRASINELITSAKAEPHRSKEIIADKVRPATDKIERRFQSICNMQKLKIGGAAVAMAAGTLTAIFTNGFLAGAGAVLGGTSVVNFAREWADMIKSESELRDMPFYLLWRMKTKNPI